MLTDEDRTHIEAAVTRAEATTSAELICVISREVSDNREAPLIMGAAAALCLPALGYLVGFDPLAMAFGPAAWTAGHAGARGDPALHFALYAILQAVIFIAVALVGFIPAVRRLITPGPLKDIAVRRAAQQQFIVLGALSDAPTGVLLFIAPEDRQVEILAGEAIHAKTGPAPWQAATQAIESGMKSGDGAAGIIRAVEICGAVLAEHFPGDAADKNQMPNRPVEI